MVKSAMVSSHKHFHLLGRAVILQDNKVLLARAKGAKHTFLPGGHVEIGESVPLAIVRELEEELGCTAIIGRYLGAVEAHFVESADTIHYEINHLFEASLADTNVNSREAHLEFFWVNLSDLHLQNLQPEALRELLRVPREAAFWHGLSI